MTDVKDASTDTRANGENVTVTNADLKKPLNVAKEPASNAAKNTAKTGVVNPQMV